MPYLCAGRQIAPSCVDANESLSAIGLHVEVAAASPAQEELQFCLTAAQQPRPHCSSVSHRIGILPRVPTHREERGQKGPSVANGAGEGDAESARAMASLNLLPGSGEP